jgi:enoyl-CoA hydratase
MTQDVFLSHEGDGVVLVTLNRPQAMNALSAALREALNDVMLALRDDETVRVVILTGAGDRAFSAGLDLKELGAGAASLIEATDADPRSNPVSAIALCGKPVIGAINGVAITGGFELALACDIRIASANARFADTHALVGVMPGWGLSQKLPRIIGLSRAKEMSFSGRFIDAETAYAWGLVNRVVPPDKLLDEARALACKIAGVEPAFLSAYRQLMDSGYDMPLGEALAHERAVSGKVNALVGAADLEGRRAQVVARGRTQI